MPSACDRQDAGNLAGPPHPGQPWRVAQAAAFLQVSERHLWRLIAGNEVKVIRLGRTTLVPAAEMNRILAGK